MNPLHTHAPYESPRRKYLRRALRDGTPGSESWPRRYCAPPYKRAWGRYWHAPWPPVIQIESMTEGYQRRLKLRQIAHYVQKRLNTVRLPGLITVPHDLTSMMPVKYATSLTPV
jgi:hypothetical protein